MILLYLIMYTIIILLLLAFKSPFPLIIACSLVIFVCVISVLLYDYYRKKAFYDYLFAHIKRLDKKYYVIETLTEPNFYEGKLLYDALYEIDKSMIENVKEYDRSINDFKDYIEMWVHETKLPVANLILMIHNHKDQFDKKVIRQVNRVDRLIEQILYYVRSENAEKDYLITSISLDKLVKEVALTNKDELLENKIDLIVEKVKYQVLTDAKWLTFIMNQIINNSIKYKKQTDSYIKISALETEKTISLSIEDNGIGIVESDLPNVFHKSFTGHNGRKTTKSTGMGLYIAKKLCNKLGHQIQIESKEKEYTKVTIIFIKNKYFDVVK